MAYITNDALKALWITGYVPQEGNYDDVWDSFGKVKRKATLDVSGETTMEVRYEGDTEPVLTKDGAGQFRLTAAAETYITGIVWQGNNDNLQGTGELQLIIADASGNAMYSVWGVHAQSDGTKFGKSDSIAEKQDEPVAGQVRTVWPNMNLFGASGWRIIGKTF
jgi:hypothetical protein